MPPIERSLKFSGYFMFTSDTRLTKALTLSRFDPQHPLSSAARSIFLEECEWASAEHYVHSQLAGNSLLAERIRRADSAERAYALSRPWYRSKRPGWKRLRRVYMTRALYTQMQMYPEVRAFLLGTGEQMIAETSQYDPYWGIGRDQRGDGHQRDQR